MHRIETYASIAGEIFLPCLYFLGPTARLAGVISTVLFNAAIGATGNYGHLHVLTTLQTFSVLLHTDGKGPAALAAGGAAQRVLAWVSQAAMTASPGEQTLGSSNRSASAVGDAVTSPFGMLFRPATAIAATAFARGVVLPLAWTLLWLLGWMLVLAHIVFTFPVFLRSLDGIVEWIDLDLPVTRLYNRVAAFSARHLSSWHIGTYFSKFSHMTKQ
jgi:hypothetical protein